MTLSVFKNNLKGLQYFIFGFPYLAKFFNHHSGIPFPPMGDDAALWRFFALVVVVISSFLPHFIFPKKHPGLFVGVLFICLAASALFYVHLEETYVVSIPFSNGQVRFFIHGVKKPELQEPYVSMDDSDAIQQTGLSDSRLEKIYTRDSLLKNRFNLFIAYLLPLVFLELTLGSFARMND